MAPAAFPTSGSASPASALSFVDPLRGKGRPPVRGGQYGARRDYGMHIGTDWPAPLGSPIYPSWGGGTARVTSSRLGGNTVTIDHGGGRTTKYMHLGRVNVQDGQQVGPDDVVGMIGMTGRSTGPHLHYQEYLNGKPVNPASHRRK